MSYIEKVSVGGTQYDLVDKNVASIEATSTASKAYAAGEYLVVGGQLCKATAAIAQNDSLVLNTNIESTLVSNELSNLSNEIVPVSDAWDVGVSYAVDDICIYNNTLYKCILAHTSSLSILPTDTTYWTATSVGGELSSLNRNHEDLLSNWLGNVVSASGTTGADLSVTYSAANLNKYRLIFISAITNWGEEQTIISDRPPTANPVTYSLIKGGRVVVVKNSNGSVNVKMTGYTHTGGTDHITAQGFLPQN